MGMSDTPNRTIILRDVSEKVKIENLYDTFKTFGEIIGLQLRKRVKDEKTVKTGFVEFAEIGSAEEAFKKEEVEFKGEMIKVHMLERKKECLITGFNLNYCQLIKQQLFMECQKRWRRTNWLSC